MTFSKPASECKEPFWVCAVFAPAGNGLGCSECGEEALVPVFLGLLFSREDLEDWKERFQQGKTDARAVLFLEWRNQPREGMYVIPPTFPVKGQTPAGFLCPHFAKMWPELLYTVFNRLPIMHECN